MSRGAQLTMARLAALSPAQAEQIPLAELRHTVDSATAPEVAQHPGALLHLARSLEPGQWFRRRTELLDLLADALPTVTAGLGLQVAAERAVDLARTARLDDAEQRARQVMSHCGPDDRFARARASEALGRVLAWRGDEMSARAADRLLRETADAYGELGVVELKGHVIFWRGNAVHYQHGDLVGAEAAMREALDIFSPSSSRRGNVLTFIADVFTMTGRWDEAQAALDEAAQLAVEHEDVHTSAYVSWQQARISSLLGDAAATERHLHEAERNVADWFDITTGSTYLADAAELLDRVGRHDAADDYLARAITQDRDDEFVTQAEAALLARRGDPAAALDALRLLNHLPWLEVRLTWRRTLLTAYASLRAGIDGAPNLTARALDQAAVLGDARIALIGEPAIAAALLPLAALAGSSEAEKLLPGDVAIRLLGHMSVRRDGDDIELPVGQPGKILRLLAVHPHGLDIEEVIEALWPEEEPSVGRRRLRNALTRLRARTGDVVQRSGSRLSLASAWVDALAFEAAADRAIAARGQDVEPFAVAALALWTGELLPSDPYEAWAAAPRERLRRRRLALLDLIASRARDRGSLEESRQALERAIEVDPYDETRYIAAARCLAQMGRRQPARDLMQRAMTMLAGLGVTPTSEVQATVAELDR